MSFTKRWSDLIEKKIRPVSGKRIDYLLCQTRFIVVAAGRRSMKTEIAKRKLAWRFIHSEPDQRFAWTAPTEGQAKTIAWDDLNKLIPKYLVASINKSELSITHINGSVLFVAGMDKPERIEGAPLDGIVLDEFPNMKVGVWEYHVFPALADRNGWAIILGVADYRQDNNKVFKEMYDLGQTGEDPNWISFNWWSEEVLEDSAIDAMMLRMSPEAALQELRSSFISAPGRAYPHFDKGHVHKVKFNPPRAILAGLDFNRGHHVWNIYQCVDRETLYSEGIVSRDIKLQEWVYCAIDEIYNTDASVEVQCDALEDKLKEYAEILKEKKLAMNLYFYGDYTGEQKRSEATRSNWDSVRKRFDGKPKKDTGELKFKGMFKHRPQPAVASRLELVNSKILNAKMEIGVIVDPKCNMLIADYQENSSKQLLNQEGKTGERTHAGDNSGYTFLQHKI